MPAIPNASVVWHLVWNRLSTGIGARLAIFAAIAVSVAASLYCLYFGLTNIRPIPFWDQWRWAAEYMTALEQGYKPSQLFAAHNVHIILTSKLAFLIDSSVFGMTNTSLIPLTYTILLISASLIALLIASGSSGLTAKAVVFSFVLLLMWTPAQWTNLFWGFQPQFAFVQLFPILTLITFAKAVTADRRGEWIGYSALAALCGFLAATSMSNGMFVGLAAVALALWLRAGLGRSLPFFIIHAITSYFVLTLITTSNSKFSFDLARNVVYALTYLGRTFGDTAVATTFGLCGLIIFIASCLAMSWRSLILRQRVDHASAILLAIAGFVIASAIVTTIGRAGFRPVVPVRYATPSTVFWACLLGFLWRSAAIHRPTAVPFAAAATFLLGLSSHAYANHYSDWNNFLARVDRGGFAIMAGMREHHIMRTVTSDPTRGRQRLIGLEKYKLGLFASDFYALPQNAFAGRNAPDVPLCLGHVSVARSSETTVQIVGLGAVNRRLPGEWIGAYAGEKLVGYARLRSRNPTPSRLWRESSIGKFDFEAAVGEPMPLRLIIQSGSPEATACFLPAHS